MLKIYGITVLHVNGFNIRSTKVERMLGKCSTEFSNGFNTFQHFQEQGKCCMDVI